MEKAGLVKGFNDLQKVKLTVAVIANWRHHGTRIRVHPVDDAYMVDVPCRIILLRRTGND